MGYCHCRSCRSYSGDPVNAYSILWKAENVRVTKGKMFLVEFKKTEMSDRQFCTRCGGHIMTHHPTFGLTDVRAAVLPAIVFKPVVHLTTVLPMKDGLPKLKDFPPKQAARANWCRSNVQSRGRFTCPLCTRWAALRRTNRKVHTCYARCRPSHAFLTYKLWAG